MSELEIGCLPNITTNVHVITIPSKMHLKDGHQMPQMFLRMDSMGNVC